MDISGTRMPFLQEIYPRHTSPRPASRRRRAVRWLPMTGPGGVQNELPIEPDGPLVVADSDPLVRAVYPLEILGAQPSWHEPEDVPGEPLVVTRVGHYDHQIRRHDRLRVHAPDGALQRPVALGVGTGDRRRFGREATHASDLHARIVDHAADVLDDARHAVAREDTEVDDRPRT